MKRMKVYRNERSDRIKKVNERERERERERQTDR